MLIKKGKPNYQSATHNIVFDGNSLVAGVGATSQYLANKVHSMPILSSSGLTVKSGGIGGQSWNDMAGNITDVNGAYSSGKRNILITWEQTNTVVNENKATSQVLADALNYTNTVKAVHSDWEIYTLTTLPRRQKHASKTIAESNQTLIDVDNEIKKNYRDYGFSGVIDIRDVNSPFYLPSFEDAQWFQLDSLYTGSETSTGSASYIHLNTTGYDIVAQYVQQKLRSIGVR